MQLPYYGVFDFIAFNYEKGAVTLTGYAYSAQLKGDAERAVKRASGVDEMKDKIEELPASLTDDEVRWRTYYAIYRDTPSSRATPREAGCCGDTATRSAVRHCVRSVPGRFSAWKRRATTPFTSS